MVLPSHAAAAGQSLASASVSDSLPCLSALRSLCTLQSKLQRRGRTADAAASSCERLYKQHRPASHVAQGSHLLNSRDAQSPSTVPAVLHLDGLSTELRLGLRSFRPSGLATARLRYEVIGWCSRACFPHFKVSEAHGMCLACSLHSSYRVATDRDILLLCCIPPFTAFPCWNACSRMA